MSENKKDDFGKKEEAVETQLICGNSRDCCMYPDCRTAFDASGNIIACGCPY
ncbi:hypothetical protein JOD44_002812 [Salimicrobium jeotgali]|nr:hypothetical protein [Salimicrobium jeotgali]